MYAHFACVQHDLIRMSCKVPFVAMCPIVRNSVSEDRRAIDVIECSSRYWRGLRILGIRPFDVEC